MLCSYKRDALSIEFVTFTKEQWATSGNIFLQNPNYVQTRVSAYEASTYERTSREQHKLRVVKTIPAKEVEILGISLPSNEVQHFKGCWFTMQIIGTTIVLHSGAKI